MDNTLRIHEITRNGHVATYNNVDLGTALNIQRGTVTAAMQRPTGKTLEMECITFVPDTVHNRCKFLQNLDVETAEYVKGAWKVIPRDWLKDAFKPAKGSTLFVDEKKPKAPPQGDDNPDKDTMIRTVEDFLKLTEPNQVAALTALIDSNATAEFKNQLITDISTSQDVKLAVKAKELANRYLEDNQN